MSEPVKVVVFVSGGVVQEVLTCGVPVEVAVIDADDDEDDNHPDLLEEYPEYADPNETETYRANGYVWRLDGGSMSENAYAQRCFNIADKANGGKGNG